MHFDFVDLRLFVNLANTKNLTRAAERSHLSLSAASARIKNLEDNLGSKLVYRHNFGVTLSPQGETFLHHARQILQQSEMLHGDMQEYSMGMKGHLRLFANANASSAFLPDVLRRFLRKNPGVSIDLQERVSHDIVDALVAGITDIGVVSSGLHTGDLEVLPYRPDHVVLVTPLQHPLASRDVLAFEEALDYDFVAVPGTRAIDAFLRPDDSGANRRMRIRVQAGGYETVCRMVEADIGIGVIPESAARRLARTVAIKVVSLSNGWAASDLRICARSFDLLPKFARDLVDLMLADAQGSSPEMSRLATQGRGAAVHSAHV
jgi:DNA-binding transcriptional LysR family regulator